MNDTQVFNNLFNGGSFTLPYLLKFTCDNLESILLVNDNKDFEYNGETYKASSFDYTPPDNQGSGATLTISGAENNLIPFIENADETYRLDVIGVISANGEVQKIKQYSHMLGTVSYTDSMEITFELGTDDRLNMTFPPYKFDTDMNRGNA